MKLVTCFLFAVWLICSGFVVVGHRPPATGGGATCSGNYGNVTAEASSVNSAAGEIVCTRVDLNCSGTMSSISALQQYADSGADQFELLSYADNGSCTDPGALLGQYGAMYTSDYPDFSTDATVGETISGAPACIWLCLQFQGANNRFYYNTTGGVSRAYVGTWGSPPDPWPTADDTETTRLYSIFGTF